MKENKIHLPHTFGEVAVHFAHMQPGTKTKARKLHAERKTCAFILYNYYMIFIIYFYGSF